jgi:hypothetical protein
MKIENSYPLIYNNFRNREFIREQDLSTFANEIVLLVEIRATVEYFSKTT